MTEQELKQQIKELQARLNEMKESNANTAKKEKQHQDDLQRIKNFRLIDDDFMKACFDDYIEGAELLLKIILDNPSIKVKSVHTQKEMKNLLGRDVVLDIDATDETGKAYNIEVQRSDKGADRKRARYHSSILDAHLLRPGQEFKDLPETYVIFITEKDVIGAAKPLYHIERMIKETNEPFNDSEHIVYVNATVKDATTELGKLMIDFYCTDPNDMHYKELADKARYFKETEKGVKTMCKALEEMREEAAREAAAEAASDARKITLTLAIKSVMDNGKNTLEEAMNLLSIPQEEREVYTKLVSILLK